MKKIPEPIVLNFENAFGRASDSEHHSLDENIVENVIKGLGTGTDIYHVGNTEGWIGFVVDIPWEYTELTSLISGADGTTNYMKVSAIFTAGIEMTVTEVKLYGTKNNRTSYSEFSAESISEHLDADQSLTVNWTLHADI